MLKNINKILLFYYYFLIVHNNMTSTYIDSTRPTIISLSCLYSSLLFDSLTLVYTLLLLYYKLTMHLFKVVLFGGTGSKARTVKTDKSFIGHYYAFKNTFLIVLLK